MPRETFEAITESQIKRASIATLADRPNSVSRYGDSNLSAQELKERFDAFPYLVQKKINEIIEALASASASKYITLADHSTGKDNLYDFIALFTNDASNGKSIADFIYALYTAEQAASPASKSISEIFNDMASRLAALESARVALQESVSNHEERISANESGIANHEERISANASGLANHEERILGIERYLGGDNFIVDDSVAYQKTVPKNAVGKAKILKIGGMTYKSKNYIPFPYADTSKTENGVTWTLNTDGSVTANGTATAHSYFAFFISSTLLTIPYDMTLSGSPSGGGDSKYQIHIWKGNFAIADNGTSAKVPAGTTYSEIYAVVRAGYTVNDLTFKPMLNEGTTALPYEPYFTGLRNAKVDELKSQGRNKFNPSEYIPVSNNTTLSGDVITATFTSGTLFINYDRKIIYPAGTYTLLVQPVGGEISYAVHIYPKSDKNFTSKYAYYQKTGEEKRMVFTMDEDFALCFGGYENYGAFSFRVQLSSGENQFPYSRYEIIDRLSIPEAVQAIDGYGCGIKENVHNYVDFTKKQFVDMLGRIYEPKVSTTSKHENGQLYAVVYSISEKKAKEKGAIISTNYNSTDWSDEDRMVYSIGGSIIINDSRFSSIEEAQSILNQEKTIIYYELETPEVTDISALLAENNFIKVEGGGTLTFENEHGYAVPSSIKYLVTYPKEV